MQSRTSGWWQEVVQLDLRIYYGKIMTYLETLARRQHKRIDNTAPQQLSVAT